MLFLDFEHCEHRMSLRFTLIALTVLAIVHGYKNEWTWLKGSKTVNSPAEFGRMYQAGDSFTPSSRAAIPNCFNHITRKFYVFGGFGMHNRADGFLSDLWEYAVDTNQWSWLGRFLDVFYLGDYSIRNEFDDQVWPSSRHFGHLTCDSKQNMLWLFSGVGIDYMDDVWAYDIDGMKWKWVKGNMPLRSDYQDIPEELQSPSKYASATVETENSFYIYSGTSGTGSAAIQSDSLWNFNYANESWNQVNESVKEWPMARIDASMAVRKLPGDDQSSSRLLVFGGVFQNRSDNTFFLFNTIIEYDTHTGSWKNVTSMDGFFDYGYYNRISIFDEFTRPSSRRYSYVAYNSVKDQLIIFGGLGFDRITSQNGAMNDMFVFDFGQGQWAWISGDREINIRSRHPASSGVSCATCYPGGRLAGGSFFDAETETFYITFGEFFSVTGTWLYTNEIWSFDFSDKVRTTITPQSSTFLSSVTVSQPRRNTRGPEVVAPAVSDEMDGNSIVIVSVSVAFAVVLLISCIWWSYRTRAKQYQSYGKTEEPKNIRSTYPTDIERSNTGFRPEDLPLEDVNTDFGTVNTSNAVVYREYYRQEFRLGTKLKSGNTGDIFVADSVSPELKKIGPKVVVKQIGQLDKAVPGELRASFDNEITIMQLFVEVKHCATIIGYCTNPVSIILRYYPHGSLLKALNEKSKIFSSRQRYWFIQTLAAGINAINRKGYIHCDISCENILLDFDGSLLRYTSVITDFRSAVLVPSKRSKTDTRMPHYPPTNMRYTSPETFPVNGVIQTCQPSRDVYAFGMVCSALMNKHEPWL